MLAASQQSVYIEIRIDLGDRTLFQIDLDDDSNFEGSFTFLKVHCVYLQRRVEKHLGK